MTWKKTYSGLGFARESPSTNRSLTPGISPSLHGKQNVFCRSQRSSDVQGTCDNVGLGFQPPESGCRWTSTRADAWPLVCSSALRQRRQKPKGHPSRDRRVKLGIGLHLEPTKEEALKKSARVEALHVFEPRQSGTDPPKLMYGLLLLPVETSAG